MINKLRYLREISGLDFHVFMTLILRSWTTIAGGITLLLLPLWLSPTQQGYYFTFASILALQIFFELGLNQIIVQIVSHETAHLKEKENGEFEGDAGSLSRFSSLIRMTQTWYRTAAILFAIIGGTAGIIFFYQNGKEAINTWLGIWAILISATAINLWLSPRLAILEGCGKVGQVAHLRLIQSLIGYNILWTMLLFGAELWSAVAIPVISALYSWYWLTKRNNKLPAMHTQGEESNQQMQWRTDIFPLQWRIALSWVSGYLIFHLFTPVVFEFYGPVEAGRLGIALSIFSAISTIGMSWINAKAPVLTTLISRNERTQLDRIFKKMFILSILAILVISIFFIIVIWLMEEKGLTIINRVPESSIIIILATTTITNSIIFAMAVYMRAHRQEPMLAVSIVTAVLVGCSVFLSIKISIFAMMATYMCINILVTLPWTIYLFHKFRQKHAL